VSCAVENSEDLFAIYAIAVSWVLRYRSIVKMSEITGMLPSSGYPFDSTAIQGIDDRHSVKV